MVKTAQIGPLIRSFFCHKRQVALHECTHCHRSFREEFLCNIHLINRHPNLHECVEQPELGWLGGLLKPQAGQKFQRSKAGKASRGSKGLRSSAKRAHQRRASKRQLGQEMAAKIRAWIATGKLGDLDLTKPASGSKDGACKSQTGSTREKSLACEWLMSFNIQCGNKPRNLLKYTIKARLMITV